MSIPLKNYHINAPIGATVTETILLESGNMDRVIRVHADQAATVQLICTGTELAGSLSLEITAQSGALVLVGVLARVSGTDCLKIQSTQLHTKAHGTSRLWVRKIVADEALATYHGTVHIAKEAVGTVVSQDDKTLLDGLRVRAESTPVLEVLTHEVICNHGSALGRIDQQMVWYIQTRGFDLHQARELCYSAFFDEVWTAVLQEG